MAYSLLPLPKLLPIAHCLLPYSLLPILHCLLIQLMCIMEWLAELFYIFRRVHAKEVEKMLAEVFDIIEPYKRSNFINVLLGIDHDLSGFAQPDKTNKPFYRLA